MAFSIGQNFFNDLLKTSNNISQDDNSSINLTYLKQKRLNDYWVNNDIPVLLNSEKYSGIKNLLGKDEPLGGTINLQRCGARNAPGICNNGCPNEYPFWGVSENKEQNVKIKNIDENNVNNVHNNQYHSANKENFTNISNNKENFTNISNNKENFTNISNNDNNYISLIIFIVFIIILVAIIGSLCYSNSSTNKLF